MTPPLSKNSTQKKKRALSSVAHIDQKIEELLTKKRRLETKQAESLMKKSQKILGEDYSEETVLKILITAQQEMRESPEKKEAWMKAPLPFQEASLTQKG